MDYFKFASEDLKKYSEKLIIKKLSEEAIIKYASEKMPVINFDETHSKYSLN